MHKVNFWIAVLLACCGVVVLVTMRNSKLRERSPMWYLYHLTTVTVSFVLLHSIFVFGNINNDQGSICLFLMYGLEYLFMGYSLSVILSNLEIFFTIVLPLRYWRTNHFMRFIVSIMVGWIIVCLIIGHLIIDNNDARRDGNYCYYSKSKTIRNIRFALRSVLPAAVGFMFTLTSITIYVLKRHGAIRKNYLETIEEILVSEKDEVNWIRATACLNLSPLLRTVSWALLNLPSMRGYNEKNVYGVVALVTVNVQSLYLPPVAILLLPDVREELKCMCMNVMEFITRGRIGSRDNRDSLTVSFANINAVNE